MNTLWSWFVLVFRFSQPSTWEAYFGLHEQRKIGSHVVKKNLKQVIPHPNYNAYTFDNDIALMELDSPLTYSDYIRPICLPSAQHEFMTGSTVWISGWGATREGGESEFKSSDPPPQSGKDCFRTTLVQKVTHYSFCSFNRCASAPPGVHKNNLSNVSSTNYFQTQTLFCVALHEIAL